MPANLENSAVATELEKVSLRERVEQATEGNLQQGPGMQ